MQVISIVAEKGGTGKTITAINIASGLARNNKVLLMDLDPQCNTTFIFNNQLKGNTIHDLLSGLCSLKDVIYTVSENLKLISGSDLLSGLNLKPNTISSTINEILKLYSFDYIIIVSTTVQMGN